MKASSFNSLVGLVVFLVTLAAVKATAQPTLVSAITSAAASATAGGDSLGPVISRDGRYVLFSSAAGDLVTNTNGAAFQTIYPTKLNVFLYDRSNSNTTLVSVNTDGSGGGNGDSFAAGISTNGQFVLFESAASNLVANDNNGFNDTFVRDVINGTTTLVSANSAGGVANGVSRSSAMTPDGRYVAFVSEASNLVAGDNNGIPDVFVRDLQASNTVLVSAGAEPALAFYPTSTSESPDISDDGRYVAFNSTATNLVPGITNTGEIYVRDLIGGVTLQASTNDQALGLSLYGNGNVVCSSQVMSGDGQFVVYHLGPPTASGPYRIGAIIRQNLVSGATDIINTNAQGTRTGSEADGRCLDISSDGRFTTFITNINTSTPLNAVEVWDAQSNATTLVSGDTNNNVPFVSDCYWPQISGDGRYVSFFSSGFGLTADATISGYHLYVRDTVAGTTVLADPRTDGTAPAYIPPGPPSMSADGQLIAFESFDPGIASNDVNRSYDIFLRDVTTNIVQIISAPLLPSLTPNGPSLISLFSASTNARFVAFTSEAENLVANDTNGFRDVFVHDLATGSNFLVSVATNGFSGNGISSDSAISGDGRYVAFTSYASNLVAGDTNFARDIFVRDLQAGTTRLVSSNNTTTGSANADSYSPSMSADGRYVLFHSKASNLGSGITGTNNENLFRRDLQTGALFTFTTNAANAAMVASMSPSGRYVAYGYPGAPSALYAWDAQLAKRIHTNTASVTNIAISPDGTRFAYSGNQVVFVNITSNTATTLSTGAGGSHTGLQFSADGRYLVLNSGGSGNTSQVVVYDSQTGLNNLISTAYNSTLGGNSNSDFCTISPDGQFIAYRSAANDIIPNDPNMAADIFLFNRVTGQTTLVSSSENGNFPANNGSSVPVFSADSQTLLFNSLGSDISPRDFNQNEDVYAYSLYSTNSILSFGISASAPGTVTWPAIPGKNYQVQFKNALSDANWQTVNGNVVVSGNQGYVIDLDPAPQKFYRVVAF